MKRNAKVVFTVLSVYFKSMCDPTVSREGVVVLCFCVFKPLGFTDDHNLLLSPDLSLYTSYFIHSEIQRVCVPANVQCGKACNLIVAHFLCFRTLSPPCATGLHSMAGQSCSILLGGIRKIRAEGQE